MSITIASATEAVEYWLNKVVLKENIVVSNVTWDNNNGVFKIKLANGIQVGHKFKK